MPLSTVKPQHVIQNLLHRTGLSALARKALVGDGRFALNFHGVSSHRRPGLPFEVQPYHSVEELSQVLAWLAPRFRFLSVSEFFETSLPGVLLTFDDGHANNLTNALPVLEAFQAQGVFFVTTRLLYEPGDWLPFNREMALRCWGSERAVPADIAADFFDGLHPDQLKALAAHPLAVIGSHTVSHPSLPSCPDDQLVDELVRSREDLQQLTGGAVDLFAYPFGEYDRRVAEAVQAAGYRAAFAVLPVGLPGALRRFEIPRVDLYYADPAYLSLKLSGLHRRPIRSL